MQIELSNIYVFVACCILPCCALITIVIALNVKARRKYAERIFEDLRRDPNNSRNLLPVRPRYIPAYIVISLSAIGIIVCAVATTLAYYLGLPVISSVNLRTLGPIILIILLLVILISLIGLLFTGRYKMKK